MEKKMTKRSFVAVVIVLPEVVALEFIEISKEHMGEEKK